MNVAKKYAKDYWDGKRRFGYGGYKYIKDYWKPLAKKLIKNYKDYYEAKDKKKNKDTIIQLKNIASKIFILNLLVIIVGFILYFRKQYSEHSSDFSFISFIFGKTQCQSMK
mgnify:CR=1 FL=1